MLLPLIGAGLGLLSNLFGGNKPQQQITSGDPGLQDYYNFVRDQGKGAFNAAGAYGPGTVSPDFQAAMRGMGNYADQGTSALRILMGQDPSGAQAAMNPYMQMMQPMFDRLRQQAVTQGRLGATSPFGYGSADSEAAQRAMIPINEMQGQFNYGAFTDMMNRMQNTAQMGGSMLSPMMGGGQWNTMLPLAWQNMRMGLLSPGMASSSSTTTIPQQTNPFQAMLGGGIAGAGAQGMMMGKGFGG